MKTTVFEVKNSQYEINDRLDIEKKRLKTQ